MGKRVLIIMMALLLMVSALSPLAIAGVPTSYVKLPHTMSALNVRSGPGTDYDVVTWALDEDEIDLIKVGSSWTKVTLHRNDKTGYIRNSYIDKLPEPKSDKSAHGTNATAGTVTGRGVNIRKGPGTGYSKVTSAAYGTKLNIWSSSGNWYSVSTLAGKTGWISKTYVSNKGYQMTTSARVNFRRSANGKLIKTLPIGTKVTVQSISGSWSKVVQGSTIGYVYSRYLK